MIGRVNISGYNFRKKKADEINPMRIEVEGLVTKKKISSALGVAKSRRQATEGELKEWKN